MNKLLGIFCLSLVGCQQQEQNQVDTLLKKNTSINEELIITRKKLDSLSRAFSFYQEFSKPAEYLWIDLSQHGFARVDNGFYVSNIETSFLPNGVKVSGLLGNLDAMSKATIKLVAAVRDSNYNDITGEADVNYLGAGQKMLFKVFIPTQTKAIDMVGFKIPAYRM